jgi:hypothetical protein
MSLDMECRWYEEHLAASAAVAARCMRSPGTPDQHANTGGPMSRRRTERVVASVLRDDASQIRLPSTLRAGLRFGDADPLGCVLAALARVGLDDPEQLRTRYAPPVRPLVCRVVPNATWAADAASTPDDTLLQQALLLGLCTPYQYDPARPVLWTRASLTRCVELHDAEGFYA